jgi:hypothetical protein
MGGASAGADGAEVGGERADSKSAGLEGVGSRTGVFKRSQCEVGRCMHVDMEVSGVQTQSQLGVLLEDLRGACRKLRQVREEKAHRDE